MVVSIHRGPPPLHGSQRSTTGAQIPTRSQRRRVDVLRIAATPVHLPGGRQELHRPHRAISHRRSVKPPTIGITDPGRARPRTIQRKPQNRRHHQPIGPNRRPAVAAVVTLHPSYSREHAPAQPTRRIDPSQLRRRRQIRPIRRLGNPRRRQGGGATQPVHRGSGDRRRMGHGPHSGGSRQGRLVRRRVVVQLLVLDGRIGPQIGGGNGMHGLRSGQREDAGGASGRGEPSPPGDQ